MNKILPQSDLPTVDENAVEETGRPRVRSSAFRRQRAAPLACLYLLFCTVTVFAQNLAQNPGFESGTGGWFGFGPASLTASSAQAHSGNSSVLVEDRSGSWNGVAQSIDGVMQPGFNYRISAWVRLASGGNQPVMLTIRKQDDSGTSFQQVASGTASSTGWTQLTGGYTLGVDGTLDTLTLYLEGPAAGVSYYADDFVVEAYDWKTEANARIEQIRKRDVRLNIVDPDGNPAPGTSIEIQQTKHHFAFGSAINGNISNPNYAAFFRANFQWAVMENESKWYANEPSRNNVTYTTADAITNYCYNNDITLRGHTIFWAVDQFVQQWVQNLNDANLRLHLTNRLNSAVNHFKGTFVHWDVNNEMLHGNYFRDRLGDSVTTWMFQHARSLDPDAKLFVNDYNVVSNNETDAYKQQILGLIADGAPVDGIGAQGHFGETINPQLTEARLDSLAELGLPIWITEYDSETPDEFVRADNLETLYRIAFSKDYVEGVLMWGFWAGSHWRGSNAAIVDLDWTLNEAGHRYQSLMNEWTTVTNGAADTVGEFSFRGFHGSYDVTLTPPSGEPTLRRVTLEPGTDTNIVTLVVHLTGARPVLHDPGRTAVNGFRFQLTGDAGRTYAIQSATQPDATTWTPLTNLPNPSGTIWITNPASPQTEQEFFRAELLP